MASKSSPVLAALTWLDAFLGGSTLAEQGAAEVLALLDWSVPHPYQETPIIFTEVTEFVWAVGLVGCAVSDLAAKDHGWLAEVMVKAISNLTDSRLIDRNYSVVRPATIIAFAGLILATTD